ncbi:histidinol dehydrogenase [Egibacter rhizosphaerae]|uniref:Histidinol dehydrogenase n=1 Tax=Egibacter rhizosphaerae TaxID=1670831 RepID=A0A411YKV9_9ACTN|nr:histidinol dehydrogenase [Egibacter rhizosphaerae]QBI21810.1 histidinol dehydrogenase [Egibacter rhizosphaerae]
MGTDATWPLRRLDLRGDREDPRSRLPRASEEQVAQVRRETDEVLAAVRAEGDTAVRRYTERFDGFGGDPRLEPGALDAALASTPADLREALERAADQIRWFHERCRPPDWEDTRGGARMGVRHAPIGRVGVYVPGGQAPLVSTALMTIVPARVAGVDEVVLATPPRPDGTPDPGILAAAAVAGGVDQAFRMGGAQAIGALAYGTESVPPCDKIVGPGAAHTAEAKQQVAMDGVCGIDLLAGVTEVAIIADDHADPRHVAADLVAQAEHDPLATAMLVTPSADLAQRVEHALADEVAGTKHVERVRTALEGQGTAVLVDDLDHAVDVTNVWGPEHLEIQTGDDEAVAARVRAAGTVFIGGCSPVSLGDYAAGPNHTLPTGGTARFTGGLTTSDFLVPVNWVAYDRDALAELAPVVDALGAAEDLPAHARAAAVRLDKEDPGE